MQYKAVSHAMVYLFSSFSATSVTFLPSSSYQKLQNKSQTHAHSTCSPHAFLTGSSSTLLSSPILSASTISIHKMHPTLSANSDGLALTPYSCSPEVSVSLLPFAPFSLTLCNKSFLVIAGCIDRWALCSQNATIRMFSRPRIAIRVIVILVVVWTLIPIHLVVYFSNNTGRCVALAGTYAFFYAIYSLIVIGIMPLFLMMFFSYLAWHNLQTIRSRVTPTQGAVNPVSQHVQIHKRDRDLMKMLSGEVLVYCVTTIPYPINLIYSVSTASIASTKSSVRLAIESLIGYIISPLLNFMYCCVQFYGKKILRLFEYSGEYVLVYAFASTRFRQEVRCLFCSTPEKSNRLVGDTAQSVAGTTKRPLNENT